MKNPVDHSVHPLLEARWSPYSFDTSKSVSSDDLYSLFEAARWAMSAYNDQPWRYIVANRATDPALWQKILDSLVEGNRPWAQHVPVLALGLVRPTFEKTGKPNGTALHDLGAASALLTVEATHRGLAVHQMSGILPDEVLSRFPEVQTLQPVTALAIGYAGSNAELDDNYAGRDTRARERKPLTELLLQSAF
jgi:nitroreductase